MNIDNLAMRIVVVCLPLILIALVAGATGYVSKEAQRTPVPQLAEPEAVSRTVRGSVQSVSNSQISIVTGGAESFTFDLEPGLPVEALTSITISELMQGDWINGGAIPHQQTTLVLLNLIMIPEPVLSTP